MPFFTQDQIAELHARLSEIHDASNWYCSLPSLTKEEADSLDNPTLKKLAYEHASMVALLTAASKAVAALYQILGELHKTSLINDIDKPQKTPTGQEETP